ncbi:hypothetical protein ACIB24_11920 [Spongisporangium articulatum]|uniref:Uncharacterized protein n=1 Tax=Spongisporangium articulatum TaxID=3362603 RepID=A0ABW8AN49_9ACTN
MFAIVVALLISLVTAAGVVLVVAMPHVRSGRALLTDDGRLTVRRARRVVEAPVAAVQRVQEAVRPMGEALHTQLDRLEERDRAVQAEGRRSAELLSQLVGPRPMPATSGPIPEVQVPKVIDLRDREDSRPRSGLS